MYKTARLFSCGLSWKEFGKNINRSQCRSRILCQVNLFNRSLSTESAQKTVSSKNNDQQHSNNEREFDSTGYAVTTKLCFALGITGIILYFQPVSCRFDANSRFRIGVSNSVYHLMTSYDLLCTYIVGVLFVEDAPCFVLYDLKITYKMNNKTYKLLICFRKCNMAVEERKKYCTCSPIRNCWKP